VTNGYNSAVPEEELLINLNKSSTTISGQLLDDNNSPVAYAPVWAYNQSTGMHMPSGTDSAGNYTIYADVGDWYVEAFIPGLGDVSYANNPVSVTAGSSASNINIRPSSDVSFATITGGITGATVTNANIWVEGTNPAGGHYHNGTNTDSSGEYRLRVPTPASGSVTYTLHAWTPAYGELAPISVSVSGTSTYTGGTDYTDFSVTGMKTLTLNFTGYATVESGTEAFVDVFKPGSGMGMGTGNHTYIHDLSTTASTTLNLPADTGYEISVYIPGLGGFGPTCTDDGANVLCTAGSGGMPDTWQVVDSGAVTFNLGALGTLYTYTVTVNDGTDPLADSFVWLGGSSFHAGEPTNSSGIATLTIPDGTYELGADRPGYTSGAPTTIVTSTDADCTGADCTKTISLSTNPYTLSGTITNPSSEAVANAWVWADKVTSASDFSFAGGWTGAQTNPDGTYELSISDGFWLVRVVSDAYQETMYTVSGIDTAIQVNGASETDKDIEMAARSGYAAVEPKSAPITPASGGTIDDLDNTGVSLTFGPAVLGSDTSAGTVNITETYTLPSTQEFIPLEGSGTTITATNSSGQAVTSLSGSLIMEMGYDEANLPAGVEEGDLMLAYYDDSSGQYVEISSSQDITNNSFSGATTHLSDFALVYSRGDAPSTPSGLAATTAGSTQINLSWTETSSTTGYYIYRDTSSGGTYPLVGTVASSSTVTYSDTGLSASTTYYYKISAYLYDDTNESAASSIVSQVTSSGGGGSGGGSSPAPTATTKPTGTAGMVIAIASQGGMASVTSDEITASVDLPANAVSSDTTVNITSTAATETVVSTAVESIPSTKNMVGNKLYNYSATSGGVTVSSFSEAVTISIGYTDDQVSDLELSSLRIYYWKESSGAWVALASTVNATDKTVSADVTHFTYFVIMGSEEDVEDIVEEETVTTPILEMTIAELKAEIVRIAGLIAQLQAQLNELLGVSVEGCTISSFDRKLTYKMTGDDVKCLQIVLNSDPDTRLCDECVGSPGNETTYFGSLTKAAVIKFQDKYASEVLTPWGLSNGTGLVGSTTREKLNELLTE